MFLQATILENGTLQIKAEKIGEDTTFGKIIRVSRGSARF